jgi:hypothetical protein
VILKDGIKATKYTATVEATKAIVANTYYSGITCTDEVWGDLTPTITVSGFTADYSKPGIYRRGFTCTNPAPWRRIANYAVIVVVLDTTNPVCEVDKASISIEASFPWSPSTVKCVDNIDGTLTHVTRTGTVDVEKPAVYPITYSATDSSGNIGTVTQQVTVMDTLSPLIGLKIGGKIVHQGYAGDRDPAKGYFGNGRRLMSEQSSVTDSTGGISWPLVGAMMAVAGLIHLLAGGRGTHGRRTGEAFRGASV